MLTITAITEQSSDLKRIEDLYRKAFPANERTPLAPLLRDTTGHGEAFAFYDGDLFCGFACLLTSGDISHIIYFAIEDGMRDKGYGSQALAALCRLKSGNRIIVDIEMENTRARNDLQRHKRKQFYLHNGFVQTDIQYRWHYDPYEILCLGGTLTDGEFMQFWRRIAKDSGDLAIY